MLTGLQCDGRRSAIVVSLGRGAHGDSHVAGRQAVDLDQARLAVGVGTIVVADRGPVVDRDAGAGDRVIALVHDLHQERCLGDGDDEIDLGLLPR